ncbi:putative replication factor C subunit 5 [Yarrowia sp. C11]|nr:putative replication factor C subunit 5 [Yarrowia sp. E02]KAG5367264.1 putative replication factor C subunit 5 [Yarrowia sp. C11]
MTNMEGFEESRKGKEIAVDSIKPGKEHLPWVEKYRPDTLDDVTGHEGVVTTLKKLLANKKFPHLLFYGPPGTGKTSTILAVAREIYGPNYKSMVLELNASDDRGIDVVRDQIKVFASSRQIFQRAGDENSRSNFKLVILDEADAMTNVAQNALRRVIEQYTTHTRFCILANYTHKLNPALLSRCTRFRFSPLPEAAIDKRIMQVIDAENVKIAPDAKAALLELSKGDMRRALNVLQACQTGLEHPGKDTITLSQVYLCVGSPDPADIDTILTSVLNDDWTTAYDTVSTLKRERGLALVDILEKLSAELMALDLKEKTKIALLSKLADIEYRLANGGSEKIQTSAAIGVIKESMELEV